jgi:hypothetical protein
MIIMQVDVLMKVILLIRKSAAKSVSYHHPNYYYYISSKKFNVKKASIFARIKSRAIYKEKKNRERNRVKDAMLHVLTPSLYFDEQWRFCLGVPSCTQKIWGAIMCGIFRTLRNLFRSWYHMYYCVVHLLSEGVPSWEDTFWSWHLAPVSEVTRGLTLPF